ncbi:MAG: tetratricopeptide repeat protein [Treponema sp.]|nr:tetratricopeptide repeat protein [Treponema sp.]
MKLPYMIMLCVLLVLPGLERLEAQSAARAAALYQQARTLMAGEDWFSASEILKESLRLNPAHAESTFALAECYYELGEFDEALYWVRRARALSRANMAVANLEAVTLIALGRLDAAAAVVGEILAREPNNREALFTAGELDIARGRPAEALVRYRRALGRFPDDRRLLISLALVSGSMGDTDSALTFINRALTQHPDDHRVFFYAAYIHAQVGNIPRAINYSEMALRHRPGYAPARTLLGNLRFLNGQFTEAARLANEAIAANRNDMGAWYLRGLSYTRLGQHSQAITVLGNALAIDPGNEFIRFALDEALISSTALEDPRRARWAEWYFGRARDFRSRNLMGQALFEYRRGLRLNPFARDRREYAELLRLQGYPARFVDELRFMQHLGMDNNGISEAMEAYSMLLVGAVFRRWQVNPIELDGRHWNVAVFTMAGQSTSRHVDAGAIAAGLVREVLVHDRAIVPMDLELRQPTFAQAFRTAREAGADYFMIVSASENERDISLRAELFVARTGASAGVFHTHRTGVDRLRNASRGIVDQLGASLPFRAQLVQRRQSEGLIDRGRADGVRVGDVFSVVQRGRSQVASQGIGLFYAADYLVGTITIETVDEEVASGRLVRNGFFDRIEAGDEIIFQPAGGLRTQPEIAANPELRALLRTLR